MAYYIDLIYSIFMFIIGTLFGSFFTLATYRIPRKQDIVKTRSYCPNCKHNLGFFDCFPILSYVSTIGRCRYCKKPISIRYPLIEFASGLVFLLIYLIFGLSWKTLILVVCYVYLFLVIGVDVMKKKMTQEEIEEVQSKKKLNKKGAINTDIILAILVFTMFLASTIFVTRNYTTVLAEYTKKTNALNLCVNNINGAKMRTVYEVVEAETAVQIEGITYNCEINVLPYYKEGTILVDNARIVESKVTYDINGKQNEVSLKILKVDNNI